MKRTLSLIAALVLALILAIPACADGTVTVTIPEADMTLSVPEELVIFTREHMAEEDLAAYNLTREYMDDLFDSRSIFLNAWNADVSFEILVTVVDNAVQDFSAFTDAQLMEMGDIIINAYDGTGIQCSNVQIYKAGSLRFLQMDIVQNHNGSDVPGVQYYILMDYKAINIFVNSYTGTVTREMENMLADIIDSIRFGEGGTAPLTEEEAELSGTAVEVLPPSSGSSGSSGNGGNSLGGSSSSSSSSGSSSSGGNSLGGSSSSSAPASSGNSLGGLGGSSSSSSSSSAAPSSGAGRETDLPSPYLEGIWDALGDARSSGSSSGGIWGALD